MEKITIGKAKFKPFQQVLVKGYDERWYPNIIKLDCLDGYVTLFDESEVGLGTPSEYRNISGKYDPICVPYEKIKLYEGNEELAGWKSYSI